MARTTTRRYRTLGRSVRLFRSFLVEQSDPDRFYTDIARDVISLIRGHEPIRDRTIVDIGAGREQFSREFIREGARYLALDHDRTALTCGPGCAALVARGEQLPLAADSVDIAMANNVMEHVPFPGVVGEEMLRVVRPGGLVFISYTSWLSPWGGHETSPWHWLGGEYSARRYERRHGRPPKNRYGSSMYPTTVAGGLAWARRQPHAWLIEVIPRYHPDWSTGVVAVPGLREVATWNLAMVLRRR